MTRRSIGVPIALTALSMLCACLTDTSQPTQGQPSMSVSNVSGAQCTHGLNNVVTCTVTMDVQLNNVLIGDTVITIATNDTLSQLEHVVAIGGGINAGFNGVKLARNDTGCLRPQTFVAAYDGASTAAPLIASAQISPITLTCN